MVDDKTKQIIVSQILSTLTEHQIPLEDSATILGQAFAKFMRDVITDDSIEFSVKYKFLDFMKTWTHGLSSYRYGLEHYVINEFNNKVAQEEKK
jgi:hypothetical protein